MSCIKNAAIGRSCLTLAIMAASVASCAEPPVVRSKSVSVTSASMDYDRCNTAVLVSASTTPASVRGGPEASFEAVEVLQPGMAIFTCNEARDWIGVVFGQQCDLKHSNAVPPELPQGCKSGWVERRELKITSG